MQVGGTQERGAPTRQIGTDLHGPSIGGSDPLAVGVAHPAARRLQRRAALPSGRAVVGGLVVAVAMVAAFLMASGSGDGPRGRVVVVTRPLTIGHQLEADDLRVEPVDVSDALASVTFTNPDDLIGKVTVAPLTTDEVVGSSAIVELGTDGPAGHAFSFPVDRERAVNGHLHPGDQVDVLATYGTGTGARTLVVARRVQVLDLESAGSASLGSNGKVVVTVSLADADQVLATAHAAEVAAITLVRSTGAAPSSATGSPEPADSYAPGATDPTSAPNSASAS
ncbi:MAG: RcpC/CpaB family pilus assembly protein [Acidimicrobiales bacterium]